ncbi:MAG TPA: alkaline phosphatase family protein [Acidimicrobiales bacterium]|jgi:phospholipase C
MGAIEHVVFLMQENRSFDLYFGSYRGVRGFDDHAPGDPGVFSQHWAANTTRSPVGRLLPFHLDTATMNAECTADLTHEWGPQHQCWNGGEMDAFVQTHTAPQNEGPGNGVLTMGYYTRADLPFYYALADAFTICDAYHCSVLGPSDPNRLFSVSATIDPDGRAGGPVVGNLQSATAKFSLSWTTMPEVLGQKGVSWRVYNPPGSLYRPDSPVAQIVSNNVLLFFRRFADRGSPLYKNAFGATFPSDFASDVAKGTLPQVSWVVSPSRPVGEDEHPPGPPTRGEWFTNQVLGSLIAHPKVWAKTALFVTYDENDGFFDHVAPPVAPAGTPGEYVTAAPVAGDLQGMSGPVGLGIRVPMLVLSPFSRGGFVCSTPLDHSSQLRFLETRFGVEVPNLSTWRRRATGDMTTALHLRSADPSTPPLPTPRLDDPRVIRECQPTQLSEVDIPGTSYPLPAQQQMPTQEPGAPRRSAG